MRTILLVDDQPIVRNILRCQLSGGYDVFEAASPIEALDICQSHRDIDLLICETDLALVSGVELASLLRAWNSKLRTILITDLPYDQWTQQREMELADLPGDDVLILERPFTLFLTKGGDRRPADNIMVVIRTFLGAFTARQYCLCHRQPGV